MNYVVIGAGAAGVAAVKEILKNSHDNDNIRIITDEDYPFYYRPRLIEYLSGEVDDKDLIINDKKWFTGNNINLNLSEEIINIDFDNKEVTSEKNTYKYDRLLLANGAHAFKPPITGHEKENIFTLRNLSDAKKIYKKAVKSKKAAVIGGGLLGIEAAVNLKKTDLEVTVVERSGWCLNRQLDKKGGELLIDRLRNEKDINFVLEASTEEFLGDQYVKEILLSGDKRLQVDLVLLSTGVRSNIKLFKDTKLAIKRAVDVDSYMRTNIEDVYAAGDIAEYNGDFYGIWLPSMKMGQVAGRNMSGQKYEFPGIVSSHTLKVAGINVVSAGNLDPNHEFTHEIEEGDKKYKRVVRNSEGKAVGLIIVGQFDDQDQILAEVKS